MSKESHIVPAVHFIGTMMVNVDNDKLSDSEFRQFIRNTLPILEKPPLGQIANEDIAEQIKKYYTK